MADQSLNIAGTFHAHLSCAIQKAYNKLITAIGLVPKKTLAKKFIEGTGGKVSVADIIAYQIGWGKLLTHWYETGIKGDIPEMPGEGFTTWDYTGLAQHFYEKYHYDGNDQQQKEFFKVVQRIIEIVEKEFKSGNLEKEGVWPWCTLKSGKKWPLSKWVKVNTESPYKKAEMLVKKILKN